MAVGLSHVILWCLFQYVDSLQHSGRMLPRTSESVNIAANRSAASLCTGVVLCQVPVLVRPTVVTEAYGSRQKSSPKHVLCCAAGCLAVRWCRKRREERVQADYVSKVRKTM